MLHYGIIPVISRVRDIFKTRTDTSIMTREDLSTITSGKETENSIRYTTYWESKDAIYKIVNNEVITIEGGINNVLRLIQQNGGIITWS